MKRFLFTIILAATVQIGWSQCTANFVMSLDTAYVGDTVSIFNTSTSTNNGVFVWSHNGSGWGNSSYTFDTTTIVNVIYNSPGTYYVCLDMYDSTWSCSDSICYSIEVIGSGSNLNANVASTNTNCGGCNGSATVTASGGTTPYTYLWSNASTTASISGLCVGTYTVTVTDNNAQTTTNTVVISGSGSSLVDVELGPDVYACVQDSIVLDATTTNAVSYYWSTGSNTPVITPPTPVGTWTYYVTVTDSNGCIDTDSINLNISNGGASVTMSSTDESCASCCNGTVTATVTGNSGYTYTWSNSAGNVTSQTGLCPGTYTITVEDTLTGCTSTGTASVQAYTTSCYTLSGMVDQGEYAKVYLIQEDTGYLTAIDSTTTDSLGMYTFSNVCNGTYYLKAALLPTHTFYSTVIPTYYDSAALWINATAVIVNNASNYTLDINMIVGVNLGGAGFVGGLVSQGANRGEGDPVVGAYVAAFNENGTLAAFTQTDANGNYSLDNLAMGTYEVYVDYLNKTPYPHQFTLSEETPESPNRDFEITGSVIKPIEPTGINGIGDNKVSVYPNPTSGLITINSGDAELDNIRVLNLIGEQVMNVNAASNASIIELNLGALPSGSYIIEMNGEGFKTHESIIVK